MRIAIHQRPGSFSDKWVEYCKEYEVPFKIVNCYASDIIKQMSECHGLMWHWTHYDHRARLLARQLTYSLKMMGKKVFPDSNDCWHFDDKVGQKYLLEAVGAPLIPSYVFYDKKQALEWAENTSYPKVFKLRSGAGSENVRLVPDFARARSLINQAFGKGFKARNRLHFLRERLWHLKRDKNLAAFMDISKGVGRLFIPTETEKKFPVERDYAYFQDYVPANDHDIRVIVIGVRAFAIKRMTRKDDFRASGSGKIIYDPQQIPRECLIISFHLSRMVRTQCLAYDFVFKDKKPLLVEISYAFSREGYLPCPGYWDDTLTWHDGSFYPEWFMIEDFLNGMTDDLQDANA